MLVGSLGDFVSSHTFSAAAMRLDRRVHDLKHTFGRRLRAAGVSFEDRQDLFRSASGSGHCPPTCFDLAHPGMRYAEYSGFPFVLAAASCLCDSFSERQTDAR